MTTRARKNADPFTEVGYSGLEQVGGIVREEWLPQLQGSRGVRVYREMADNDPVVGAALFTIETLARAVHWEFQACDNSPEAQQWAEFANECMHDMQTTWVDVISESLTFLNYGWAILEKVYRRRVQGSGSRYRDGRIGWRALAPRSQDTLFRWEYEETDGQPIGMVQQGPPRYETVIVPLDKCLHFKLRGTKGNPEGRSLLRNAYRPWFFKKRLEEVEGIAVERNLAGLPVMELPLELMSANAGADAVASRKRYEQIVMRIRQDKMAGLVIPPEEDRDGKTGYRFRLLGATGKNVAETDPLIKRYESRILMSVLSEFLLVGMDKVGSFSLHSDKTDLYIFALNGILGVIREEFDRSATPELLRLNGAPSELAPKLVHTDVEKAPVVEMIQAMATAVQSGVISTGPKLETAARHLLDIEEEEEPTQSPSFGSGSTVFDEALQEADALLGSQEDAS